MLIIYFLLALFDGYSSNYTPKCDYNHHFTRAIECMEGKTYFILIETDTSINTYTNSLYLHELWNEIRK